jgi:cell shape-determining protein MreC
MLLPNFTTRQWFWSLTFVAFLWAYIGTRTAAAPGSGSISVMQGTQNVLGWPMDTVLTPGSFVASSVERMFVWIAQRALSSHEQTRSNEALEQEVKRLGDVLETSQQTIAELRTRLEQIDHTSRFGIAFGDLFPANIKGFSPGAGSSLITIDKGRDHLRAGMAVISDVYIVGRVVDAGPATATVRLLTDPRSRVRARILHDGAPVVDECLLEGMGNGQIMCNTVAKTEISTRIEKGDRVELFDNDWPVQLRHFIIGTIADTPRGGDNPYRYNLRIVPSVNVNALHSVDILIR